MNHQQTRPVLPEGVNLPSLVAQFRQVAVVLSDMIDKVGEFARAFVKLAGTLLADLIVRWVIEARGITEVDVRRIDWHRMEVVLWNRRRIAFTVPEVMAWAHREVLDLSERGAA